jgi:hypothetical protein
MNPSIVVIISAWEGHPVSFLRRLIESVNRFDAGEAYDLALSVNGSEYQVPSDLVAGFRHIMQRENVGFNLGAWDHAWRRLPEYDHYLFLQDECFVRRKNWLRRFSRRLASENDCGLVGEHFNTGWNHPWETLLGQDDSGYAVSEKKRRRAAFYFQMLQDWGIPPGDTAAHLTTVVQYTSRRVLEEVDGYPIRKSYREAIAAEIGFSRKIAAAGYCLRQVGRWRHSCIGHPQWPTERPAEKLRTLLRGKTCRAVR